MSDIAIKVENLSKQYRLGLVGTGTISHDLNRWWHRMRGLPDPYLKVGESNDRSQKGESDYVWALKDINFEIKQGEVVGIIGKNGAGKSTLLKILSNVTSPTTGSIKAKGRIASLLEVGTGFHPELTGRENIYLNGTILGMTKREVTAKLEEIVEFSGVARYIDTPVKRYSSGMMVRLGFAVAAHLEPEILIVDEVLAVGDAEFQKKAIGKMQEVSQGGGRTVLFVSHNMDSLRTLCSTGILLANGQVVFTGAIGECIDKYLIQYSKLDSCKRFDEYDSQQLERAGKNIYGKLISISLKTDQGKPAVSFMMGDTMVVDMELDLFEDLPFPEIGLAVSNQYGSRFFHAVSSWSDLIFKGKKVTCQLTIPKLLLYPGEYKISTWFRPFVAGPSDDFIENALHFGVELGSDFSKRDFSDFKKSGGVYVEQSWKIHDI